MSLESLIDDSGQQATITAEAPGGRVPGQTALGGADRSDANWLTVADGLPCLVRERSVAVDYGRNDARASVVTARIYFVPDDVAAVLPSGLSSRHRITVTVGGEGGPITTGVYAVKGAVDPNSMGRVLQVDCERIRTP